MYSIDFIKTETFAQLIVHYVVFGHPLLQVFVELRSRSIATP